VLEARRRISALDGLSGTHDYGWQMTMLPLAGREREIGVLTTWSTALAGAPVARGKRGRQRDVGPAGGGEHLHLCARMGIQR
jgi:hypothetical protein